MILCYGIIPLKRDPRGWSLLLVLHRTGHWSLPKGHPEPDEEPKQTAERELFEETGLTVTEFLPSTPFVDHYEVDQVPKEVIYYPAAVKGELKAHRGEVLALRWVSLEKAAEYATFPSHQALLREISDALPGKSSL